MSQCVQIRNLQYCRDYFYHHSRDCYWIFTQWIPSIRMSFIAWRFQLDKYFRLFMLLQSFSAMATTSVCSCWRVSVYFVSTLRLRHSWSRLMVRGHPAARCSRRLIYILALSTHLHKDLSLLSSSFLESELYRFGSEVHPRECILCMAMAFCGMGLKWLKWSFIGKCS